MTEQELNQAMLAAENDQWDVANKILDGFGVEFVECCGLRLKYINLGGTYDQTICFQTSGILEPAKPWIGSWGQWIEDTENEFCESEGLIRCGYCSEFTLQDTENWQDTICQHCGNLVGG